MLIWSVFLWRWLKSEATFRCPSASGFHLNASVGSDGRTGGTFSKLRRTDGCRVKGALFCNMSSVDYLLSPLFHSLPVCRHFFQWKLKWNLAVLPLRPLKVSQVLTSSLLTSLRHKNGSLPHLFGRHCSGHRMHLVISLAITSTADSAYQGWRFRPWWGPSAPIMTHALWQQVPWWKNGTFDLNGSHQCSLVQSSTAPSLSRGVLS